MALLHLPAIQRRITPWLSGYLSSKFGTRVEIGNLHFSLLGDLRVGELTVWDAKNQKALSVHKIEVVSNIVDIISGRYKIDTIRLADVDCHLMESQEGWNIQSILDAFRGPEKQDTASSDVTLQFNTVLLENIVFEYASTPGKISLSSNLGRLVVKNFVFSSRENVIEADDVSLRNTALNILSTGQAGTINPNPVSKQTSWINPDLGMGIGLVIRKLELRDDEFSFHVDQVVHTPKADPDHLELRRIQTSLSDVMIRKDTLTAILNSFSTELPGLTIADATVNLHANQDRLVLSGLRLASKTSELEAELMGWSDITSTQDPDWLNLEGEASGHVDVRDLEYFFQDSLLNHFSHWESTALVLKGKYIKGEGNLDALSLKTKDSYFLASGRVWHISDYESLQWKNVVVNSAIGADAVRTLRSFFPSLQLPPYAQLHFTSAGNPGRTAVTGNANTSWGDVRTTGSASFKKNNVGLDFNLVGKNIEGGKFARLDWLGPASLSMDVKGRLGHDQDINVKGMIGKVEMVNEPVQNITFRSEVKHSSAHIALSISDTSYRAKATSEILFSGPLIITTEIETDRFRVGNFLSGDSTLSVSGNFTAHVRSDRAFVGAHLAGNRMLFQDHLTKYSQDTLNIDMMTTPTASRIDFFSDDGKGSLTTNFDLRHMASWMQTWPGRVLHPDRNPQRPTQNKAIAFDFQLRNVSPLLLLGANIDDFSSLHLSGEIDEQKQEAVVRATSGKFKGYGLALDTLRTQFRVQNDSLRSDLRIKNLYYQSLALGNLNFDVHNRQDTTLTNLILSNDSTSTLVLRTRILRSDSGAYVYPDKLRLLDTDYTVDRGNPVYIEKGNIVVNNFQIAREAMRIGMNGDLNAFDLTLSHVDFSQLNALHASDSILVNGGELNAKVSYTAGQQLDLSATIDSLRLYRSNPLTVVIKAVGDTAHVPFEVRVTNELNQVDVKGQYFLKNNSVDASMKVDVHTLEIFNFLVSGIMDKMDGSVKGDLAIRGPIQKPKVNGQLRFSDANFTTANPRITFVVQDDVVTLKDSVMSFKDFGIYDRRHHRLIVNGSLISPDYRSLTYDLKLHTNRYSLLSKADSLNRQLKGELVVAGDVALTGNTKNANVKANIIIKDSTSLIFQSSDNEIKLLTSTGIVDFVDPTVLKEVTGDGRSGYFYDSLLTSLPEFNLNSTVKIEEAARMRIAIDAQSGDYIEASGSGNLEMEYDRTGNVGLSGTYTIKKGTYRVSFYELAKKNFKLVPGSSVSWSGRPESGELNIRAIYTVRSSSIGLIGNEIGENEKSIYKRSLPYEVGITIKGTIGKPVVSFSLDLPREDRVNYPVLANKLDRLQQPEFQSELNKQVFGILVLGGFMPESTGLDINEGQVATTALSNSVNSLLSGQLNRFANRYIKGVDIDVGIQSYSDYSAPGGKTQTAMDFRMTKRVMNDRLSFEVGGDFNINQDQSGASTGDKNFRGDVAIIYDLTGNGNKKLKLFNNETYDIVYQEVRNTGISLIFIREFDKKKKDK
ncbi:MAG TPA: translocation/assembly module TamB domain-containing protein [Chryseolinea sp.]